MNIYYVSVFSHIYLTYFWNSPITELKLDIAKTGLVLQSGGFFSILQFV